MLTLPEIVTRGEQPYVAIRERVRVPFNEAVDRIVPELFQRLAARGIEPVGALFFRYTRVAMPDLEIEFGVPTQTVVAGDARLVTGMLPRGEYASVTYFGHYRHLMDVNAVLIGWARQKQLRWDASDVDGGEHFGCRLEIYETDPATEPDPDKWQTTVAIRLAQ